MPLTFNDPKEKLKGHVKDPACMKTLFFPFLTALDRLLQKLQKKTDKASSLNDVAVEGISVRLIS